MQEIIKDYLEKFGKSTQGIKGNFGDYGLLFALFQGEVLRFAELNSDTSVTLTTVNVITGEKRYNDVSLIQAVTTGLVVSLQETCYAYERDQRHAVVGEIGSIWAKAYAETQSAAVHNVHDCLSEFSQVVHSTQFYRNYPQ